MNKINFTTGVTDLLMLSILKHQDSYMYDIINAITRLSDGKVVISQNTAYTVAYRLEKEGKIKGNQKTVGKKRTRVYYHIEPQGEIYLKKLLKSYKETAEGIAKVLSSVESGEQNEYRINKRLYFDFSFNILISTLRNSSLDG